MIKLFLCILLIIFDLKITNASVKEDKSYQQISVYYLAQSLSQIY